MGTGWRERERWWRDRFWDLWGKSSFYFECGGFCSLWKFEEALLKLHHHNWQIKLLLQKLHPYASWWVLQIERPGTKKNSTDSTSNFVMTFGISKDMSIDREIISSPDDAAALAFFLLVNNSHPSLYLPHGHIIRVVVNGSTWASQCVHVCHDIRRLQKLQWTLSSQQVKRLSSPQEA